MTDQNDPIEEEFTDEPRDAGGADMDAPAGDESSVDDAGDAGALRAERDALYEKLARVQADFRNSQRRLEKDAEQRLQYANADLVRSLLPAIDSLERAMSVDAEQARAADVIAGLSGVRGQFIDALSRFGVEVIAPERGEAFDPSHHEALLRQPDDEFDEPTVTQLLNKGYKLHGRVMRPAQVAVSA